MPIKDALRYSEQNIEKRAIFMLVNTNPRFPPFFTVFMVQTWGYFCTELYPWCPTPAPTQSVFGMRAYEIPLYWILINGE